MASFLWELTQLYRRLAAAGVDGLPIEGFANTNVKYLLELKPDGTFARLTAREAPAKEGKKGKNKKESLPGLLTPAMPIRGTNILAGTLVDMPAYIWGLRAGPKELRPEEYAVRQKAFYDRTAALAAFGDAGAQLVRKYLDSGHTPVEHPLWPKWQEQGGFVAFQRQGATGLLCQSETAQQFIREERERENREADQGICLITGDYGPLERLHPTIKLHGSGLALVSFNISSSTSYGKSQGENAPVGRRAAFEYTAALNWLLGSAQMTDIGPVTYVFWTERPSSLETGLPLLNTFERQQALREMLESVRTGKWPETDPGACFVLGLREAPDGKRLNIVTWFEEDWRELRQRLLAWFADLGDTIPLGTLLGALHRGKDKITEGTQLELAAAAFEGQPLPNMVLGRVLGIEAVEIGERNNARLRWRGAARQALLRAYLIRNEKLEVPAMLDDHNNDVGYLCGRLLARLEQAQVMAIPRLERRRFGAPRTLVDKHYWAAFRQPVAVFPQLLALNVHHLTKAKNLNRALGWWMQKQVDELVGRLGTIPSTLTLAQQGMFALGFRHERKARWEKKSNGTAVPPEVEQELQVEIEIEIGGNSR